MINYIIFL
jgi:KRAB domain-containing zinc finger protein